MVSKLTQNRGVDYVVVSQNIPNCLLDILADEAKFIDIENIDLSAFSSLF